MKGGEIMNDSKSNQELKIGDLVKLKSGGPAMTVNNIEENGQIYCRWFVGGETRADYFSPDALQLVEKSP